METLLESLGKWRNCQKMKIHAEEHLVNTINLGLGTENISAPVEANVLYFLQQKRSRQR